MANVIGHPNSGEVVLGGTSVPLATDLGRAYTADCCRNWERILSNGAICEKYNLSLAEWQQMGANKQLVRAVREEHERRIRNGSAAQELASLQFAGAPRVLGDILRDPGANARHKIEAHRELRATANGTGPDSVGGDTSDRYIITINLGATPEDKVIIDAGNIKPRAPSWEGDHDAMAD
jgi:hypothetical protein